MNRITRALADTTSRVLARRAEITAVVDYGPHFRSIDLAGDALRKAKCSLGDKIQVRVDNDALTTRTYTPLSWDTVRGATRLLTYAHGTGPGSAWIKSATPGVSCQLFGPHGSLKLDDLANPVLFVGDESSFAVVSSWHDRKADAQSVAELFEVNDPDESGAVLEIMGLASARLIPRREGSAHVAELADAVVDLARTHPEASLCLTGRAQTIAVTRQRLKAAGLSGRPTRVKAYWDELRRGLD